MQTLNDDPRRVLVIDDNDAIHDDFRKILSPRIEPSRKLASAKAAIFGGAGEAQPAAPSPATRFEVQSAYQGEEGLQKLQAALNANRPFAVAFVDMRMPPGWDGVQTIQRLWEVDPNLQVVICTAYSDHSWEEISQKLGLTDRLLILKKPFDPVEATQLATALSEKWMLRQAARLKLDQLEQMVQDRTRELSHVAMHDKLTGLPNRAMFHQELEQVVRKAQTDPDYRYAILFLDFDRFKTINDSLGHAAGDELLKGIAERLAASLRLTYWPNTLAQRAMVARLGGDEFVAMIDGYQKPSDVTDFAANLVKLLSTPYHIVGRDVPSTVSIGVTTSELRYSSADEVLRDADTAMYHAKATGRARYVLFDRAMHETVARRLEMECELRSVVQRDELVLHLQPIVALDSGDIKGFEALVRWNHPKRGLIPPGDFIGCCEETGLILPIGYWVLRTACQALRRLQVRFPALRNDFTISVNISRKQLAAADLVQQIRQIIAEEQVPPQSLALEITESAVIGDMQAAVSVLQQIRALGVHLHIDDFGTGYSSLSCLHEFPLNGLKIDRRFILNVSERRDYAAVVHAIVNLARNLGMKLIAEGIESADQVALLQAMDCDLAQGFYFGRSVEISQAEALIAQQLAARAAA
jgi:diguanylate cyclase (GGDEF)-like protein